MADTGIGASIASDGDNSTFLGSVQSTEIDWDGIEVADHKTSHLGTETGHTYIPHSIPEPGALPITFHYDADSQPTIGGSLETVTLTYPSGATHAFSGYINRFKPGGLDMDGLQTAEVRWKISGDIDYTAAS